MTTTDTRDRLRRWRTPIVSAAVAGGLLLGGYGIAAAADSGSPSQSPSPSPEQTQPEQTQPDQTRPDRPGEGHGCDQAPAESSATT
ncbi:hypothetical protein [Jiangella alba]|uniref:Uncharacterized protein n=1 Tax=Jiangella alba TaxID=561176 RepID=A0A1H5PVN9_9ACTN|nr:hypothetical protein [Jiangella alba]SEF17805.1 hypothetical protein SAMN04488561_6054 [Jiangella alba]